MRKTAFDRFKSKCRQDQSGCILWTGTTGPNGYGRFGLGNAKYVLAHRWIWIQLNGPIQPGLCILHSCDVRNCVNPLHLRLGTHADNSADMKGRGRSLVGERHHNSKLTEANAKKVIAMIAAGKTRREIADRFSISVFNVTAISRGIAWKHIPRPDMSQRHNGCTKLLPDQVAAIRRELAAGTRGSVLARHYAVSEGTISMIKLGKTHI